MTRAREPVAGHAAGIWTPLTSLTGRDEDAAELTRLVEDYRLVTVTGPGGVGKTRLAAEVARRMGDRFPDGVWFIELSAIADVAAGADVAAEVTAALGVRQDPGRPSLEILAQALAPRRLLLLLDNCEHVLTAAADLCEVLLTAADDVRILATSREQLGAAGETRYRLSPLGLPGSDDPEAVRRSAATVLFTEHARRADPRFALTPDNTPLVARVVTRLDGMPLAIELAAARVEALGLAGLADRLDDAPRLLTGGDRLAAARHRSLAAVADWSYQLLAESEQQVFRRLAVFPGPFALDAAEAVAGPDAGPAVLRLVDCSLLVPPRPGADQRTRYTMLQTLRAYALTRLREAGEEHQATAALAAFAASVADQAANGLETSGDRELDALHWLDAEDATLSRALTWELEHGPERALRLANTLTPWLRQRGRPAAAYGWLSAATARTSATSPGQARAQIWLGRMASNLTGPTGAVEHLTTAIEAYQDREPSRDLVEALTSQSVQLVNAGDVAGAARDAHRAVAVARELDDPTAELRALACLSITTCYTCDATGALGWARQAQELLSADVSGEVARWSRYALALVLTQIGQLDAARRVCADGLTLARQVDDRVYLGSLHEIMALIDRFAGNLADSGEHLREAVGIASLIGDRSSLRSLIQACGYHCAATGRWAQALTLWAACAAEDKRQRQSSGPDFDGRRAEYMRQIEQELDARERCAAEERGVTMTIPAAAELALMAIAAAPSTEPGPGKPLSPRERELVTLVAQGHTNADIAARLHISVRTVTSHLDRIRDKTGYRRRADLTRLAVEENLV